MKFTFFHNNINVLDLDKSVEFTKKLSDLKLQKNSMHRTEASNSSISETAQHHIHWS